MVSFQCEGCGDVLTKKKLDQHFNRCRNASFTCLDCMTQFFGYDYKKHTSCISEAEKYQGSLFSQNQKSQKNKQSQRDPRDKSRMNPPRPYVEDAPETPESYKKNNLQLSKPEAPPKVPTPPPAAIPPDFGQHNMNVFDYMVQDDPKDSSEDNDSDSYKSFSDDSTSSLSSSSPSPSPKPDEEKSVTRHVSSQRQHYEEVGYAYGEGPVEPTLRRFDSRLDLSANGHHERGNESQMVYKTPAPNRNQTDVYQQDQSGSRSDRKRKRNEVEDLKNISETNERGAMLHSGLTGGLDRLLTHSEADHRLELSPLSPKKKTKRSSEPDTMMRVQKGDTRPSRSHHERKREEKKQKRLKERSGTTNSTAMTRQRREDARSDKASNYHSKPVSRQIEYNIHKGGSKKDSDQVRLFGQSNSEFFLSLVSKGHRSVKGQSIWGVLKNFHQGLNDGSAASTSKEDADSLDMPKVKDPTERKLFKGLRLKMNKKGEVVLFSRREAEDGI